MSRTPEICIIAAMSENRVIGKDGQIPWRIPEDMKHFKDITVPDPVIMGRKTWDSIPEKFKPLPERVNIIISRTHNFYDQEKYGEWLQMAGSLEEAVYTGAVFSETGKMFIAGGGQIYQEAFSWYMKDKVSRLYLTIVEGQFEGDTYFPDPDYSSFKVISEQLGQSGEYRYKFLELEKSSDES